MRWLALDSLTPAPLQPKNRLDLSSMNSPAFTVCVYCGSRNGNLPVYSDVARQVGTWIGQHNGQLVYGGGGNGLMGLEAQATADAGGRVVGIIPKALKATENMGTVCTELYVVDTMHERKHMMDEAASALRLEIESDPQELEKFDEAIMKLEIEKQALKKEQGSERRLKEGLTRWKRWLSELRYRRVCSQERLRTYYCST